MERITLTQIEVDELKNLSNTSSDEVKQCLRYFCEDIRSAEINFAPQRASSREATIEKIETYLSWK